jgi:hypothetical protein
MAKLFYSHLLGALFLQSDRLGMFGPYIPPSWSGHPDFDFREIYAAKRRNWRQSRGHR